MCVHNLIGTTLLIGAIITTVGCSAGEYATVTGTVTYDSQLVEDGAITFFPIDGKGPTSGSIIKEGKYLVTKVPVGKMKVSISGSKVVGRKKLYDAPNSPEAPITQEYIPARYNVKSELTLEVRPGENQKDWHLTK